MRRDLEERKGAAGGGGEAEDNDFAAEGDGAGEDAAAAAAAAAPMDRAAMRAHEKAAGAAARAAVREAQEAQQALKAKKADKYAAKNEAREAERAAAEAAAKREDAIRAEKQAAKDAAEFDQWKDLFTVQDAGTAAAASEEESQSQLEQFIAHIKSKKVVVLDEVAAAFKMKTPVSRNTDRINTTQRDAVDAAHLLSLLVSVHYFLARSLAHSLNRSSSLVCFFCTVRM